jgi:hypothetical protein
VLRSLFSTILMTVNPTSAADTAQKLSGAQIRTKFAGMEMTDGAHWADVYERNGTLRSFSMGSKTIGKWRVQKDELCVDLGDDPASESGCYEVWLSKENVELRPSEAGTGSGLQGILQRPNTSN